MEKGKNLLMLKYVCIQDSSPETDSDVGLACLIHWALCVSFVGVHSEWLCGNHLHRGARA